MASLRSTTSRRHLLGAAGAVALGAAALPQVSRASSQVSSSKNSARQTTAVPAKNQTVRWRAREPLRTIDPGNALEAGPLDLVRAAYEGLAADVFGSTQIRPQLATSWKVSPDATTYTFTLRQGVKFHDGTLMDATAVKKSYDRVIQMNLGPAGLLQDVNQVNVVNPSTVEIRLKRPNVYFIAYVPKIAIVSPTAWEKHDKGGDLGAAWLNENTAGTGPFKLKQIRPNQAWVLDRFADYWRGWEGPHIDQIQILVVPEAETAVQMLESGQLEYAMELSPDDYKHLQSVPGVTVHTSKNYEIDIITLNVTKPPLNDVRVRQALQLAFDYEGFQKSVMLGWSQTPNGPIAPGYPSYDPSLLPFKQDMAKAKDLLAAAGVKDATFEANYVTGYAKEQQSATVLQSNLQQLGINVDVKPLPWSTMVSLAGNKEQAPALSNLLMSTFTADPSFTLQQNYGSALVGKPYNWSYYSNPKVDQLIQQAQAELNQQKSYQLLQQAQKIIVADAPAIFYANPQAVDATSSKVQNYAWDPIDYYWQVNWYDIWLSK